MVRWKPVVDHLPGELIFLLGGKYFTAFRASTFNDEATIFCGHTGPKAMGSLAFDHARLECSLHLELPVFMGEGKRSGILMKKSRSVNSRWLFMSSSKTCAL